MEHILTQLTELVKAATENRVELTTSQADVRLETVGVDSLALLNVMVAIEERFKIEWDPDVSPDVFSTLQSMAEAISERTQTAAA
jgi:acyl carrier protein